MKKCIEQSIRSVAGSAYDFRETEMIDADFKYSFNIAALERRFIGLSEKERTTIAGDAHNDLGSHLCGVELLCKVLQKKLAHDAPDRAEELDIIRNLIRQAIGGIPSFS